MKHKIIHQSSFWGSIASVLMLHACCIPQLSLLVGISTPLVGIFGPWYPILTKILLSIAIAIQLWQAYQKRHYLVRALIIGGLVTMFYSVDHYLDPYMFWIIPGVMAMILVGEYLWYERKTCRN